MANLDITELLTDPDFVDTVLLIHRTTVVDAFGQNVLHETFLSTIGSVQPATGKDLLRLPDALRQASVSLFFLKGAIVTDGNGKYPDLIQFRCKRYQVQNVLDYSNWGPGWSEGTCIAEKPI